MPVAGPDVNASGVIASKPSQDLTVLDWQPTTPTPELTEEPAPDPKGPSGAILHQCLDVPAGC